jgi:uncharacterized membrane protein
MLNEFMQTLQDPHARHAMIVHIPIALGALGVLPLLGLAATKFASRPLALLCVAWFLAASAGAALAANAGEAAEKRVEKVAVGAAKSALHDHEELGENGWLWPLIPAALAAMTRVPRKKVAVTAGVLAIVGALGVAGWTAYTGHTGGRLVYTYGLGVPAPGAAAGSAPTAPRGRDED